MKIQARKVPTNGGRAAGVPNKTTGEIKSAISMAVTANVGKISQWLNEVADGIKDADGKWVVKPDPGLAVKLTADLTNFVLPQLRAAAIATTNVNASLDSMSPGAAALLTLGADDLAAKLRSFGASEPLPEWLAGRTIDVTPEKSDD